MNFGTLGAGFGGLGRGGAGAEYEAEAVTLFAAMLAAGSEPDSTRKGHINTLIAALKTAGVWSSLDLFYVLAAHDTQAARLNWKTPASFALTNVGAGPTFETDRGATGNGTSTALATGYTPSTNAVNLAQDDMSMWVWSRTDAANNASEIGDAGLTAQMRIATRSAASTLLCRVNDMTSSAVAIGSSIGLSGASRANSTTRRFWKDGVEQGSGFAVSSTGLSPTEQWICGANNAFFSAKQVSFAAWGNSLTGKELALYNAVNAYMTSVGAA